VEAAQVGTEIKFHRNNRKLKRKASSIRIFEIEFYLKVMIFNQ
jgi:hypothetical protein